MTTAEIMADMKFAGCLVTVERLKARAERLERDNAALLATAKALVERGTDSPEHQAAELAIAQAEAA